VPEGDVVWRTARQLHEAFASRRLVLADLRWPRISTVDLRGREVVEVVPRGKHLLMRLAGDPPLTLHSHLRMDGSWRLQPASVPPPRSTGHRDDVRAVLATADRIAVGRRLGMLDLVRTADEASVVGHLGPDVLGDDWDPGTVARTLAEHPDRAIGDALLDQEVLAGVGTFYMAEALFLRGLSPWTPVGQVADVPALLDVVHRLLVANRERVGQITTGDTRPGRTQWVHGRHRQACRRCGGPVLVAPIGQRPRDRVAFFCPHCQPGPRPGEPAGR
jgi:endonuclease-8